MVIRAVLGGSVLPWLSDLAGPEAQSFMGIDLELGSPGSQMCLCFGETSITPLLSPELDIPSLRPPL